MTNPTNPIASGALVDERTARQQKIADITQDVAPDLGRAVARLQAFCDTQHDPNPPQSPRDVSPDYPALYFADVRAILAALRSQPVDRDGDRIASEEAACRKGLEAAAELARQWAKEALEGDDPREFALGAEWASTHIPTAIKALSPQTILKDQR